LTDVETYFSIAAAEFMIILAIALYGLVRCLKNKKGSESSIPSFPNSQPSGTSSSNNMIKDSLLTE